MSGDPDLVMINDRTKGLSPRIVQRVAHLLQAIAHRLHGMDQAQLVREGTLAGRQARNSSQCVWLKA